MRAVVFPTEVMAMRIMFSVLPGQYVILSHDTEARPVTVLSS